MEQNVLSKNMWTSAGNAGLALGAVSAAYLFAGQLLAGNLEPAALWQQVTAFFLWVVKLGACIWLMKFFMTKFACENAITDNRIVFRMGMTTALLSALMYSAIYLANMLYISADFYEQTFQAAIEQMKPTLDSNSLAMTERLIGNLPKIMFFYNLTYCTIFGTVLSAIISRTIVAREESSKNEQDEL